MFVVDTNVLIYAADVSAPAHERCRIRLESWRKGSSAWYVTWPIIYEFLRVTTHPRVFRSPWSIEQAWQFASTLLASPSLGVLTPTSRHQEVAAEVFGEVPLLAGNLLHDAHTAVLMREHGVRTVFTRDTDFHRFPFLEPVDPLLSGG